MLNTRLYACNIFTSSQTRHQLCLKMDISRSPSSSYHHNSRISPKKSPTTDSVQRRRQQIKKSEKAAFWALFNSLFALILYYEICYIKTLAEISSLLVYVEWSVCIVFATSACYDFIVHFWPYTFMRPIVINQADKKLLGIKEDEFGFQIQQDTPVKQELTCQSFPPFEIHYSFEE